jgi:hypothetical protein
MGLYLMALEKHTDLDSVVDNAVGIAGHIAAEIADHTVAEIAGHTAAEIADHTAVEARILDCHIRPQYSFETDMVVLGIGVDMGDDRSPGFRYEAHHMDQLPEVGSAPHRGTAMDFAAIVDSG